eukprot:6196670-Pleurochrysis_carterae.AAC.1
MEVSGIAKRERCKTRAAQLGSRLTELGQAARAACATRWWQQYHDRRNTWCVLDTRCRPDEDVVRPDCVPRHVLGTYTAYSWLAVGRGPARVCGVRTSVAVL